MAGPLRILHVVVNMNRGGAETFIMNLYRNIDKSKVQFDFLTCKEGVFDAEILKMGGIIHRIPYITDVGHFGYFNALKDFFTANKQYYIIHSHLDKMSGLVLKAAKQSGIPIRISHCHSTRSEGGIAARAYKSYIGHFVTPNSTHLVACSKDAAKWLFRKKHLSSTILKNGIDMNTFKYSPQIREKVKQGLKIDRDKFIIGHVGRFDHPKNHIFLLDIFAQFNNEVTGSVLILVGDGILRSEIERKIRELNLEGRVYLLGIRNDIPALLQAFDLFLFPSLYEGLPLSLIEAQGAGLPCLISDHISKEVDLGLNLIEYASLSNVKNWVDKIKKMKDLQCKRIRGENVKIKQGFDIQKTAKYLENYYFTLRGEPL